MRNRWAEDSGSGAAPEAPEWAAGRHAARLLAGESGLVLRGQAVVSIKSEFTNIFGESVAALFVTEAGGDNAQVLDLNHLRRLSCLPDLSWPDLLAELQTCLLKPSPARPPAAVLLHAVLPGRCVVEGTPASLLAAARVPNIPPAGVLVCLPDCDSELAAAHAVRGLEIQSATRGLAWRNQAVFTWGDTAEAAYEALVDLQNEAEKDLKPPPVERVAVRQELTPTVVPIVRGVLAQYIRNGEPALSRVIVQVLAKPEILACIGSDWGQDFSVLPPLSYGALPLTKPLPLWISPASTPDPESWRSQISRAVTEYAERYRAYLDRQSPAHGGGISARDAAPRIILIPGIGALCAGSDLETSLAVRDIARASLSAHAAMAAWGPPPPVCEPELFRMEYRQAANADAGTALKPLSGRVALVTGAAGAIGAGISEVLLSHGCAVALADLPGERLSSLEADFRNSYGELARAVSFDVGDRDEVAAAFREVILAWGGLDLVVANAGVAVVAPLAELDIEAFRKLERVNIEGTLNILAEAGRHFQLQDCGGDIVLISTKNVFAPGAKFGAYSATKAAAHQLARIASLELAEIGVRVNMVAPDAVFGHKSRSSGLWNEVGADRARSLGIADGALEDYYQKRNLLKTRIAAADVGRAVLYFATHQSPTTGATIPVDGGLPNATPR